MEYKFAENKITICHCEKCQQEAQVLTCIEEFKDSHHLSDIKDFLWHMLQGTVQTDLGEFDERYRGNLVFFCRELVEMFETVYT